MKFSVIDLHCDLLGSVEYNSKLTFTSAETNCSVEQLQEGGVGLQVFAVAAITKKGSTQIAERQIALFKKLLSDHAYQIQPYGSFLPRLSRSQKTQALIAIENASGLCEEDEPLERAFERFEAFQKAEKILYVGLTWNHENRFGGGNEAKTGLKPDGERLLEYLSGKNVAIDLSHTSDALAYDIINFIEKKNLTLTPIASHSNFRAVTPIARNLPDDIAQAIVTRGGVIGLNFVRRFVGDDVSGFFRHISHALKLQADSALCLGADFYGGIDISALIKNYSYPTFQSDFSNASCYPKLLSFVQEAFGTDLTKKIAYENAWRFLKQR